MQSSLQQLKVAYEVNNMTVEEIAEDFKDFDVAAIKAGLMQCSSKYRRDCKCDDADVLNFTDEQLDSVNKVIFETALSAEYPDGSVDYKTRLHAATYIRDDKKGRKEVRQVIANGTFNFLTFNEQIQAARQAKEKQIKQLVEV